MNKTEKRMKIFTLIMQVIIQAVLLFPWMNMGTWKCNVPGYLIKLAASGDGMSYIKKSLKPLGVLDGADEQMMVQILMLFICELVMVPSVRKGIWNTAFMETAGRFCEER